MRTVRLTVGLAGKGKMMSQEIECKCCGKHMGTLRDAKIRNGMVVYCQECDERAQRMLRMAARAGAGQKYDVPDFMRGLFGG